MKLIENIGEVLIKLFNNLGKFVLFVLFFFNYLFKPKFYLKNNLTQVHKIMIMSLTRIG